MPGLIPFSAVSGEIVKQPDSKASVWENQGALLYLSPLNARRLILLLHSLCQCLSHKSRSEKALHAIRRNLSDLLYALSPLSKTGKMLFELLDKTQTADSLDRKGIQRLVTELREIYRCTDRKDHGAVFLITRAEAK